jgi:CRISPR-associated exonuclease Cas4
MKREFRYSEDSDVSETYLTPTDIKQFVFCPRVTYFTRVLKMKPILGSQQEAGKKTHKKLKGLENRRKRFLKTKLPFSVKSRVFEEHLVSEKFGVRGVVDLLLTTTQDELIPVEFKMMRSNRGHVLMDHKYQLLLLGLLIEEAIGRIVRRGVIYYMKDNKAIIVVFSHSLKQRTKKLLSRIRTMILEEHLPNPRRECNRQSIGCGFADRCPS